MLLKRLENLFLPKIPDGVTSDELSGYEFDYGAIDSVNPDTLPDVNNGEWFGFNQGKYTLTKQACTIVNSLRNLGKTANATWGIKLTNQDMFDCVNYGVTQGYKVGQGRQGTRGVDVARKRWNQKYTDKLINSYMILTTNPDYAKIKLKGYGMSGAYNGSDEYNKDYRADAVLDGASFGPRTYGHWTNEEKGPQINDSYYGNSYNIYKVMQPDALVANGVRSNARFFFAPAHDNSAEIKRLTKIKTDINTAIAINSKIYTDDSITDQVYLKSLNTANIANRKKLQEVEDMLKNL